MLKYGFFNSIDNDRRYNADDVTKFLSGVISDGIYRNYLDSFATSAVSGMTIAVSSGKGMVLGRYIENTDTLNLTVEDNNESYTRYDAVVIACDLTARECSIYIKQGTSSSDVSMINTDNYKEIPLYTIMVSPGTSSIDDSALTDVRYRNWIYLTNANLSINKYSIDYEYINSLEFQVTNVYRQPLEINVYKANTIIHPSRYSISYNSNNHVLTITFSNSNEFYGWYNKNFTIELLIDSVQNQ